MRVIGWFGKAASGSLRSVVMTIRSKISLLNVDFSSKCCVDVHFVWFVIEGVVIIFENEIEDLGNGSALSWSINVAPLQTASAKAAISVSSLSTLLFAIESFWKCRDHTYLEYWET